MDRLRYLGKWHRFILVWYNRTEYRDLYEEESEMPSLYDRADIYDLIETDEIGRASCRDRVYVSV